jgi:hypothetical protein
MKAIQLFFIVSASLIFSGCESELPDRAPSVGTRLKRGFRGEGNLYIPQETVRPTSPAAAPIQP